MTICIAAICQNGKEVVVASDRMLTIHVPAREFEHESSKIEVIAEKAVMTTAGDALAQRCLLEEITRKLSENTPERIRQIGEIVREAYVKCRLKRIEALYLTSRGLPPIEDYYSIARSLPPEIYMNIDANMQRFNYNLIVLVAGVDNLGGHIYRIVNPGVLDSFTKIGYCAIGSGEHMAISSFITNNYSPRMDRNKALYLVYEAKKMAEHAPGVGPETDLLIISSEGITEIDKEIINKLESIYNQKLQNEINGLKKVEELIREVFSDT